MNHLLRFVQRFEPSHRQEFLDLERGFIKLEQDNPGLPQGKRYLSILGREPQNTLIWECQFASLSAALGGAAALDADPRHGELFALQVPYIIESYAEVYEAFDL
jgi:hypothetical protein